MAARMKNVVKNLVKENQRIGDYKSPYGVKFWNSILKVAKELDTRKHKVREENMQEAIDRVYRAVNLKIQLLNPNSEEERELIKKLERQKYQLSFFRTDEWKNMFIVETARLKKEYRKILWLEKETE